MAQQKHRTTLDVHTGVLTWYEKVASVHGVEWQLQSLNISRDVPKFEQWLGVGKGKPFAVVGTTREGKSVSHFAMSSEESYARDTKGERNRMNNYYWRAYRRAGGKLVRQYVGATITLDRLRELATDLDGDRYDPSRNELHTN